MNKIVFMFCLLFSFISLVNSQNNDDITSEFEDIIAKAKSSVNSSIDLKKIDKDKISSIGKSGDSLLKSKSTAPKWVKSFPKEKGYFVGIGSSSYTGDIEKDNLSAMNAAINMLAGQIETKIVSEAEDIIVEDQNKSTEYASLQVKTFVKQNLSGLELVDAWYNKKQGIWYYYRLSEEKYFETQKKRLEVAKETAIKYFLTGMEEKEKGNLKSSAIAFLNSYTALSSFPLEKAVVNFKNKEYNVFLDSKIEAKKLFDELSFTPQNKISFSTKGLGSQFVYLVKLQNEPFPGVPMYYISKKEKYSVITDEKGVFVINLKDIGFASEKIFFGLDVEKSASSDYLDKYDYKNIENALGTLRSVDIKKEGPLVFIEYDDKALEVKETIQELLIKDFNSRVVDTASDSRYILALSLNAKTYPPNYTGIVITDGTLTISMKENDVKKSKVFALNLDTVKGQGLTIEQSIEEVCISLSEQIKESDWTKIKEELEKVKLETFVLVE
ncbi:MAG: LPP20 family lipoprotein [Spirochaetes bacterium]|nr:LPP20 family lipoprotein [Spirochaetota bacterium]